VTDRKPHTALRRKRCANAAFRAGSPPGRDAGTTWCGV
jgi:hypothetical protein